MPRAHIQLYYHLIWATRNREPILTGPLERAVHRSLSSQIQKIGGQVHAINGMPDHVHLLIELPATVCVFEIVKQAKGATSRLAKALCGLTENLYWQEGYAAYSISQSDLGHVAAYIQNQKRHHADGTLMPSAEFAPPAPFPRPEDARRAAPQSE